jgi:hypothetical protein
LPRATTATAKKAVAKKAAATIPASELVVDQEGDVVTPAEEPETGDWFVPMDESKEWANVLLWGREGAGKSTAIARLSNLPGHGKILMINAEGGLKPTALRKRGVDTSRLLIWPKPGQRITRLGLENVYRNVHADLMKDPDAWLATAWDSASEIYQVILSGVQEKRVKSLQRQGKDPDVDFVDRADYGTMSKMVRDLLRKFRDLPCHFFVTALERKDKDEETKKLVVGPSITPALQQDILGYVDMSLYMKAGDEQGPFRAMTHGSARYRVKDRFDVLPRILSEPMGDRIIAYLHGDLTEDADPFQDDLSESVRTSLDVKPAKEEPEDEEEDDSTDDNDNN